MLCAAGRALVPLYRQPSQSDLAARVPQRRVLPPVLVGLGCTLYFRPSSLISLQHDWQE
jgi:hypothetical protein